VLVDDVQELEDPPVGGRSNWKSSAQT